MKVAIVGSRDGINSRAVIAGIGELLGRGDVTGVISGGARGVDSLGAAMARDRKIPVTVHHADWRGLGRSAGFQRNALIVADADEVHAWWNGKSRGTQHTIELAKRQGKPTFVHVVPGTGEPRRPNWPPTHGV